MLGAVALGALLFVACDVHGPTAPGSLARLVITPSVVTLPINGTQQYTVEGFDAEDRSVALSPTWSVVAGGGEISATGHFTAGTVPGEFPSTVQASSNGMVAHATVTVVPGALASITVSPDPTVLTIGATRAFVAVGKDAAGDVVPIDPVWSVVAGGGIIGAGGTFTAGAVPGTFANTVRATSGGLAGTATVTVTTGALATITVTPNPATMPTGATRIFTAVGRDARGNVVAITPSWSVVAGGGVISDVGAFVAGSVPGTYENTVTASSGGITGTATVIVTTGALATITVSPNPVTLTIGGAQLFTAVGRDASGNVVALTPTWSVVAGGGAITNAGLFTAGAVPGTYVNTVRAASGGIAGTATVTVTTGAAVTITVTPNPVTLPISATQAFVAVGRDAAGNVVAITPVWSVVAGGGSINAAGLFVAGTVPGTFSNTVTATSGGVTGAATVTVTAGVLTTITVTPNPVALAVGATQTLTAVGTDAGGNVVAIAPTWSVVAGGGAISAAGVFTAGATLGTFANTVTATSGGVTGTATVTVGLGAMASLTVTPSTASMPIGGVQQFTAVGRDAGGNVVAVTPTWTIVAGGGSIGPTGLFRAGVVTGTFVNTVQASSGGLVATATVVVTAGPLAAIILTPDPVTLAINGAQQFTAVGLDAGGNVIAIAPTWAVVAGGGLIDGTGRFTAGTLPGTYIGTVTATSGAITADATVTVTAGALSSITVSPNPVTLPINGTHAFVAVGRDAAGNVVPVTPTWAVVAGGATIDAAGMLTAGTVPGTYTNTVQATSGGVTGRATITVTTGALAAITITPSLVTLPINGTQLFTAVGTDASGNVVAITPTWAVVAGGGAIVPSGLFTAGTLPGTFTGTITASSGGIVATATVTVSTGTLAHIAVSPNPHSLPINGVRQFVAVGTDASGNVVPLAPVWSIAAGGGAINATGLFTAGTVPGTFANTVTATSGGISGSATVTVTTGPLATLTVTPNPATLAINGAQQFTAVGRDAGGNVLAITPVWSVVAGGGAISGAGLFTAGVVPGTFTNTVRASSGGIAGLATVTVTTGALATITVSPAAATLPINGTQPYTAVGRDAGGNVVPIAPTWSVVAGGGTITGAALFTAGTTPGVFTNTVSAAVGAIVGTATVTVTTGVVASLTVTPNPTTLAINGVQQMVAVARDAGGNVVPMTPVWAIVAGGGAVSGAGVFTAGTVPGTFVNTVRATSGGVTGTATVTITAGPLATLTVTPSAVSLPINGTQQFTAVGRDAGGNVVPTTTVWTLAAGGGSMNAAGLFTAGVIPGTYTNTVMATSGGISATATVTVSMGPVATIAVAPDPATMSIGGVQSFTAIGRDAGGNVVPITPIWSVAAGGGAITGAGLFTAGTVPGTFANTINASSNGVIGDATVIVTTGALATITVTPGSSTLSINGTQQATAVGRDAGGNIVAIVPTWSVVAGGGTIGGTGLFTAGTAPGTFANTIQATSGGIVGTASVTVTIGALATITVTPVASSLAINASQQYTAVGADAAGNPVAITTVWTVAAGGGVISGAGLFVAGTTPGTFVNTVTASSGGVTGTATVTVTTGALATITVTPSAVTLPINGTQQYTAVGRDLGGNVVALAPTWSVVSGGGAIAAAGLFTAGTAPGTFTNTVQAASGSIVGTATVTVTTGVLAAITVTPNPVTLAVGGTQTFTATGQDAGGNPVALTPTWSVASGGGTISAGGQFTAGTVPGTFTNTVRAVSGSITGAATVTVTTGAVATITVTPNPVTLAINGTQLFTAVGTDVGGNVVAITPVWSIAAGGGAITGAGMFTAGTVPGTFTNTVTASSGGVTGTATVTVTTGTLATITVTPSTVVLPINGVQQYTAVGRDAGGNVVGVSPTWSVVASGGTITGTGFFTAGTVPGAFANTVQASSAGITGHASVTVTSGVLTTLTMTPASATLPINGSQTFTVVGRDAGGNVVASTPTWSVVAGGGVISGGGVFTAGTAPGTFTNTVTATSGVVAATASVTVTTGALASIVVTPSGATLPIGGTQQFTAVGRDAGGNVVALTPVWSITAGGGTIDGAGLFSAGTVPGTFTNTVTVTSGGVSTSTTVTVTTGAVASVTVSPDPATLAINGTQAFSAVGRDAGGNVVAITPAWSVVAGGGAVSASGVFTAGTTPGTFAHTVVATAAGVSGDATVLVMTGALASITVTPSSAALPINGTQSFTAVGRDAGGNVVALTPTWSVVAGGGTIDGSGLFTAGTTPGTYTNTVRATSGAVAGSASVTVATGALASIVVAPNPVTLPIGGTQSFTAVGRDAGGNVVAMTPVWTVAAGGGAISGAGLFTAGTVPGTFTNSVTATSGGVTGTATVTITIGGLATLTVSPNPATLAISATQQFTAVGRDAGGNVVAASPTWSVAAGGGTINGSGLFTAGTAPGTYAGTVVATSGAVSGNATVTVTTGVLTSITVTPNTVTLPINGTQTFTAVGRDAGGNVVALAPTWSVVSGGGGISAGGLFSAGTTPGTFTNTVQASSGGVTGSATVTVTAGVLTAITITPSAATVPADVAQQFTAVGTDAGGNIVAISPDWSVVAGGGVIDGTGLFTAGSVTGTFTNTVQATSGGVTARATVTVTVGVLASITVTPSVGTMPINGAQQFTAVGRDAGGNVVAITPSWSVVAGGGSISAAGLFTAGTIPGTFTGTVRASSGAVSGVATVTVTTGPLATITVTPNPVTLAITGTQQFTAVGRDAGGNVVTITPSWSVVAGGGAVGVGGLFTAGVVPGTFVNTVQATSGGVTGTATVTVTTGTLQTITVTPNPVTLAINGAQQFTAVGRDAGGNVVAVAPTWAVVAGGGSIGGSGLFTAGTLPGTFTGTVQASSGAVTGTATVTVTTGPLATITLTPNPTTLAINGTQQFTAVGRDAGGNVVALAPAWSVAAGGGSVDGSGLFTAGTAPGTFTNTVVATSGSITGTATVIVTTGPLATVTVTPNPVTLAISGTQQFTAVGRDAGGNVLAIAPVWSIVASGGAIGGSGLFTAGTVPGTYTNTVQASSGGITGRATVVVTTGALATITVTPNPQTLAINGAQQFTAVGRDAGGNVVAVAPTWAVVAGGGSIGGSGLFTAGTLPGTFTGTVQASSGAVTGTATVTVTTGPLASITVSPNPITLAINGTQQFTAVGRDAGGNVLALAPTWSVAAGGGAINASGMFVAGTTPGTFANTVVATSGSVSGTATVAVITGALSAITVSPNPVTLPISGVQQFTAVGTDAGGNVLAITPVWSIVASGGAIGGSGLFTAGTIPGTYTNTVQASSGGVTGTATVTVTTGPLATIAVTPNPTTLAINGTQQFTAVGRDAGGNVVALAPTWTVVASGGAINATGLFTAGTAPGTFANTVQAASGSITGTATVTVTTGPLATITVSPNPTTLAINGTQQFTAVGRDAGGNVVALSPTWSVAASGGAINATGLFTAGTAPGTFANTVVATSGAVTGTATVTVTVGPLASITVTPHPTTLAINGTQQFTAVGRDAGGNVVALAPTWTVVAAGGAINATGLFSAGTVPGTFTNTVQAASGSVTGAATVTITTGPLVTITVTPNPITLAISGTQQFTAVGTDAGGNVVALTPSWTVVAGGGTIDGAGLFTAGTTPGNFAGTVRATSGAITGAATVTVVAGPLATITVTPNPVTLAISGSQQFTAVGRDIGGNVVALAASWSMSAGGGAINGTGLFTAGTTPGTYANTVVATSGSITGTATVTVTTGPLSTITVTPNPTTLAINATQQFTAVGRDAGGNVVTLSSTWSVAAGGGAINGTGLFTAGTVPGTYTGTVVATSGAVTGTATVTVTAGPLASITVSPNPATLYTNGAQQFTALGKDAGGNTVAISPTWSVVAGGGTINGSGLFAASFSPGTFTNTVQATSGGVSGYATVVLTASPPAGQTLGTAATHGVLAGSTITCVATGTIGGDASVSPGTAITGFPPCVITGTRHSADAFALAAQNDLTTAFNAIGGLACTSTISADLGGTSLAPGVACGGAVGVTGTVTLNGNGDSNAIFVIRAASTLTTAGSVVLTNGAQAHNVFWWVGTSATLGGGSAWQGNILVNTSITLNDGATVIGRALARAGAVTLGAGNTITLP
ncbi:MAG: hypothetical protein ACYC3F_04960 [Gemmatimonadaceae bacterium]